MKVVFHDYDNTNLGRLRGYYDSKRNVISIMRKLRWQTKVVVFAHEVGHWLIACCIYDKQRKFDMNGKYDILWAKIMGYDCKFLFDWYESEAKRCNLKFRGLRKIESDC